jgi:hypothetical protein
MCDKIVLLMRFSNLFIYGLSTMLVAQTIQCLGLSKLYQLRYNIKRLVSDTFPIL